MAFCINCGKELSNDANFCGNCGKAVVDSNAATQRRTVYDGEIHKCPVCGDIISAYDVFCKSCGYEIRGRKSDSVVHELSLKLEKTDEAQKEELIRTFYIPNTREDIHEFFILALSQIKIGGMNTDAWMVKLEQAYQKAELSFGGTQDFGRLKPMYEQAQHLNRKNAARSSVSNTSSRLFKSKSFWPVILGIIALLLTISFGTENGSISPIAMLAIMAALYIGSMSYLDRNTKKAQQKKSDNLSGVIVGTAAGYFYNQNYEDVREQLKAVGFRNIVVTAEKKGLLDTEGAVKGISIAGNTMFSADDVFDAYDKIIIRYYSKKY